MPATVATDRVFAAFARLGIDIRAELDRASSSDERASIYEAALARAKAAYRRLLKEAHPDQGGTAEATQEIVEAWETIKDTRVVPRVVRRLDPDMATVDLSAIYAATMRAWAAARTTTTTEVEPEVHMTQTSNPDGSMSFWWAAQEPEWVPVQPEGEPATRTS